MKKVVLLTYCFISAAFGGLLSLMLGFTLISGFDLVLFLIFKVIYDSICNYMGIKDRDLYANSNEFIKKKNKIIQEFHKNQWFDQPMKNELRRW